MPGSGENEAEEKTKGPVGSDGVRVVMLMLGKEARAERRLL